MFFRPTREFFTHMETSPLPVPSQNDSHYLSYPINHIRILQLFIVKMGYPQSRWSDSLEFLRFNLLQSQYCILYTYQVAVICYVRNVIIPKKLKQLGCKREKQTCEIGIGDF